MPSWNEKAHVTPTINVNLKPCTCGCPVFPTVHVKDCTGIPVHIPCHIPRSVTFYVPAGECCCPADGGHLSFCPAYRLIHVTCSIGGDGTWAGSEVTFCESMEGFPVDDAMPACRDRWPLVRALLRGDPFPGASFLEIKPFWREGLFVQRYAVFSALADMARAEEVVFHAQTAAQKAFLSWPSEFIPDRFMDEEPHSRPSASILARYVERLIEQVGTIEGGE